MGILPLSNVLPWFKLLDNEIMFVWRSKDGSITIPPYAPSQKMQSYLIPTDTSWSPSDFKWKLDATIKNWPKKMHDCSNALRYDQRRGDHNFLSKRPNRYYGRGRSLS
ncbi:hypothetical protein FXO37_21145 [Capsicum annuum]|nr:hypothetical protein FXO37_21145 [Capsicum annuum]